IALAGIWYRDASAGRFEDWERSTARSADDGSFVLEGVHSGRIILNVQAADYASREIDVVVTNDTPPVELALSAGGSIRGRLVAADGVTPVAGSAGLYNLDVGAGGESPTGPNGEFF